MAIITKSVLICNKCGKETEATGANMSILGEDFFLCDECLERLINWVSRAPLSDDEVIQLAKDMVGEKKPEKEEKPEKKSHAMKSKTKFVWDDYKIDNLLSLREWGYSYAECAMALGTTEASVMNVLTKIRTAEVGYPKYPYKARLLAMGRVGGKSGKKARWNDAPNAEKGEF